MAKLFLLLLPIEELHFGVTSGKRTGTRKDDESILRRREPKKQQRDGHKMVRRRKYIMLERGYRVTRQVIQLETEMQSPKHPVELVVFSLYYTSSSPFSTCLYAIPIAFREK